MATLVAFNSVSQIATAGEGDGTGSYVLVCTSDPWDEDQEATHDGALHDLTVRLTSLAGPTKGDTGSSVISAAAQADYTGSFAGLIATATTAVKSQTVTMAAASGGGRPQVVYTPPSAGDNAEGVKPQAPPNGFANLETQLKLTKGRAVAVGSYDGNAAEVQINIPEGMGNITFELNGDLKDSVESSWSFSVMSKSEYREWKLLNGL